MAAARRNARRQVRRPPLSERLAALRVSALAFTHSCCLASYLSPLPAGAVLVWQGLGAMPVERIEVSGKLENLRREAVRAALAGELDAGLVFLNLGALQAKLEELPWIYRASLRRRFPDTLEVGVVEQLPIARWGDDAFLNHEARIISVRDSDRWRDLPQIRGPQGSAARLMARYQRLLEQFSPVELNPVIVQEDDFGQLSVTLDNGLELQLGNQDFAGRLQQFLHLWRGELRDAQRTVLRVDMRYENGAAVAFEQVDMDGKVEQVAGLLRDSQGQVTQ
jgi:cell division protein FtsQ